MEQQLLEQIIQIKPANMHQILPKIIEKLSSPELTPHDLSNITKSLFYGLWNFDKMINQHNLSTAIAEMLEKLPSQNAFKFLYSMLEYIQNKYNLIDKHRINKFMQLVKYLIKKGLELDQGQTDTILMEVIFNNVEYRIGISYHVAEIYFELMLQIKEELSLEVFGIFQRLLGKENTLEHFRLHIMEHIYEKYKGYLVQRFSQSSEQMEGILQSFAAHFMELAQKEDKDHHRKNIYTLIGFIRSDQMLFSTYMEEKQAKAERQKQKRKKKLSKHKKKIIKEAKVKRRQLNKKNKKPEVLSKSKLEMAASNYR